MKDVDNAEARGLPTGTFGNSYGTARTVTWMYPCGLIVAAIILIIVIIILGGGGSILSQLR